MLTPNDTGRMIDQAVRLPTANLHRLVHEGFSILGSASQNKENDENALVRDINEKCGKPITKEKLEE